jgi:hypothetical protein
MAHWVGADLVGRRQRGQRVRWLFLAGGGLMLRNGDYGQLRGRLETPADAGGATCLRPSSLGDPSAQFVDESACRRGGVALIGKRIVETQQVAGEQGQRGEHAGVGLAQPGAADRKGHGCAQERSGFVRGQHDAPAVVAGLVGATWWWADGVGVLVLALRPHERPKLCLQVQEVGGDAFDPGGHWHFSRPML